MTTLLADLRPRNDEAANASPRALLRRRSQGAGYGLWFFGYILLAYLVICTDDPTMAGTDIGTSYVTLYRQLALPLTTAADLALGASRPPGSTTTTNVGSARSSPPRSPQSPHNSRSQRSFSARGVPHGVATPVTCRTTIATGRPAHRTMPTDPTGLPQPGRSLRRPARCHQKSRLSVDVATPVAEVSSPVSLSGGRSRVRSRLSAR
ncbi:hypothetical protein AB0D04_04120 [Streptomyces sp. NPDC048483]|uniref:hypothetical protein n=1 Tax=Streptomyces sp. NPDC048483 TaxID=3154927 RepID=UPI003413C181